MADKEFKLTIGQGQFLLQMAAVAGVPDKLGEQTFTAVDRAIIQGMMSSLFATLKSYSLYAQEYEPGKKSKLFFGPKDEWANDPKSENLWHMKDPKKVLKVRLSTEDVNAAAWCGFLALVPRSATQQSEAGTAVSPAEAAETVIPMLKAVGKWGAVADQLGMKKFEQKKHGWSDDAIVEEIEVLPAEKAESK